MPKLWALKDFTSSIYKLHKITNSPSPLQKYLVKHVLYCFSLTGQAAKAKEHQVERVHLVPSRVSVWEMKKQELDMINSKLK